jgi:hypothetical protein
MFQIVPESVPCVKCIISKISLLLLVTCFALSGCSIRRATESDLARWHGFRESERVPSAETRFHNRCYQHKGQAILCYDLDAEDGTPTREFPRRPM